MRQLTRYFQKNQQQDLISKLSHIKLVMLATVVAMTMMACAPLRHTPFGEQVRTSLSNLNGASLDLLPALPSANENSQISFSILTDSHANYDDLAKVVQVLNQKDDQFVVNLGDMTDLGLAIEYEAFASHIENLRKPLFSVIGNHDTIGNGKAIYQNIFGAYNYTYDLGGVRFVYFNNNALDFFKEGIDLNWLEQTVQSSPYPVIIFQHVDPLNAEYFTAAQREQILRILNPEKVMAVFHGHNHKFRTYEVNDVLIQQVARVQRVQFSQVQIEKSGGQYQLTIENCQLQGGSCEIISRTYGDILK